MASKAELALSRRDKLFSFALILLLHLLAIWGLIIALGLKPSDISKSADEMLIAFNITAPPPELPPLAGEKRDETPSGAEGEESAASKKAKAAPVFAPKLKTPPPTDNQAKAASKPRKNRNSDNGLSNKDKGGQAGGGVGDGTGAGGSGEGAGGGGTGDGAGVGGAGAGFTPTPAQYLSGKIAEKDYRKFDDFGREPGAVIVWFTVTQEGRAQDCEVTKASNNPKRDAATCSLIEERWRYEPARGPDGKPRSVRLGWKQEWWPRPE